MPPFASNQPLFDSFAKLDQHGVIGWAFTAAMLLSLSLRPGVGHQRGSLAGLFSTPLAAHRGHRPHKRNPGSYGHQAELTSSASTTQPSTAPRAPPKPSPASHEHDAQQSAVTTFKWPAALGGNHVQVIGSFNGWQTPVTLGRASNGDFVRSMCLPPGAYQFKYIVDDVWMSSPCEQMVADGDGNYNNYRLVQPTAVFTWRGPVAEGGTVLITGDWSSWGELVPLRRDPATGHFRLRASLQPGTYTFAYLVDDAWQVCPDADAVHTEGGALVNRVEVKSPPAFSIFYATGWDEAVLRVRLLNEDGVPLHPGWREVPMHNTASRSRPKGGVWKTAVISATRARGSAEEGPSGEQAAVAGGLEFYVTNGDGTREDRPQGGGSYRLMHTGGFKLRSGRLVPFPKASEPPMMLVSDLDGTMVGDTDEANAYTAEFCQYWEENSALAGCPLVYNTGRSLGSFVYLFQEKAGALALPDVLITAVGTKIFRLDTEGGTRGTASGAAWREDLQWARSLDEGWDLAAVKRVAQRVVETSGDAAHWLDGGTEHPHRVALSVRDSVVGAVVAQLQRGVEAAGVQVQIITSGVGDWRYVDCVSRRAGKLNALEYVRSLYGVARERCVAAGDSGNDILMLGGANPAVVVGNAQPELVQWVLAQPQTPRLMMCDAPLARGLLEGLARHGLF